MPGLRYCWECRKEIPYEPLRYRALPVCNECAKINKSPQFYAWSGGIFAITFVVVSLWKCLA